MSRIPTDHDPRAAIRGDLVSAARRRIGRRRRRRSATLATLAAVGLLSTTAGALALGGYTTGVPVIDGMLDRSGERLQRSIERSEGSRPALTPPMPDHRPGPGSASEPVEIPWLGDPSRPGVAVAYSARGGSVCLAAAESDQTASKGTRGMTGCMPPKIVADELDDAVAFVSGVGGSPATISGYARAEVDAIRIEGPDGTVEAHMLGPWTPTARGAKPIRPFIAYVPFDVELPSGPPKPNPDWLRDFYALLDTTTAVLDDGSVVDVEPMLGLDRDRP